MFLLCFERATDLTPEETRFAETEDSDLHPTQEQVTGVVETLCHFLSCKKHDAQPAPVREGGNVAKGCVNFSSRGAKHKVIDHSGVTH